MIPVIYIAGKYRDVRGTYYIRENIRAAERAALHVWKQGAVVICPHKNSGLLDGAEGIEDKDWLEGYLELVRRSDAVYAISGWEESTGARGEVALARELGKPVFFTQAEVVTFVECFA